MTPEKAPPPALSAPDLIGPISILNQPLSGPRLGRRNLGRPYSHVQLRGKLSLSGDRVRDKSPAARRVDAMLRERNVTQNADLLVLSVETLHALAARRFRWVDHWEVSPGGWLPLPVRRSPARTDLEPVGDLLNALEGSALTSVVHARRFAVRLSDLQGDRADVVIRRLRKPSEYALALDLRGRWTKESVEEFTGALTSRLPGAQLKLTRYQYV